MKKLLAILLALGLVLMSFAAMADVPAGAKDLIDTETANDAETPEYSITKKYTTTGGTVYPAETLQFEVTDDAPTGKTYPAVTVADFEVDGTTDTYTIPVVVPPVSAYESLGIGMYHYEVKETGAATPSQGATYDTDKVFNVDVYVYYKDGALVRTAAIYSGNQTAEPTTKNDTFENEYSVGGLTVTKTIAGNLADPTKEFTIVIKLTSENTIANDLTVDSTNATAVTGTTTQGQKEYTITATLKGDQSVTISNIPTGAKYTIEETLPNRITENTPAAQMNAVNDKDAYFVEGEVKTATAIAEGDPAEVTIKNTKEIKIPEGISVDFVPYVLIIALAGIALVAMKARKKEN